MCLFLRVRLEQGGDVHVLDANKRHIEKWEGKKKEADSVSFLPKLPQTLAHRSLPAPPSTPPAHRNVVEHIPKRTCSIQVNRTT